MGSKTKTRVWVVDNSNVRSRQDQVATEEPLEIRLTSPQQTVAVTMRTPGADFELAAGFLYAEGIVRDRDDIQQISYCVDPDVDGEQRYNIVNVKLRPRLSVNLQPLERHFFTTSACGVCGKASLEALHLRGCSIIAKGLTVSPDVIYSLPEQLHTAQRIFSSTGGLHAAALFDTQGKLLSFQVNEIQYIQTISPTSWRNRGSGVPHSIQSALADLSF